MYNVYPCLFISDKVICLVYVDEKIFFSPEEKYIDEAIKRLLDAELELKVETLLTDFLAFILIRIIRIDQ